jgi:dihydroorotase
MFYHDASGLLVRQVSSNSCPLREPGYEWKETIKTGNHGGSDGGFSSVVCMANKKPVNDNKSVTIILYRRHARSYVRVFPVAQSPKD